MLDDEAPELGVDAHPNAVIEGKDEAEVMAKGVEHAKTAHKMTAIPPDMAAKVKAAIKEKK